MYDRGITSTVYMTKNMHLFISDTIIRFMADPPHSAKK